MKENELISILRKSWIATCSSYSNDVLLIQNQFEGIIVRYQEPHRHYHTCQHIGEILQLIDQSVEPKNKHIHVFAAFFHDVVYVPGQSDNEIRSAELAEEYMQLLKIPQPIIDGVEEIILATQMHQWFDENIPN